MSNPYIFEIKTVKNVDLPGLCEIDTEAPHLPGFIPLKDVKVVGKDTEDNVIDLTSYISLNNITKIQIADYARDDWAEWIEANFGKDTQTQE